MEDIVNLKLKMAMLKKGVKGFDVAKHLDCDPSKVSKILNGWLEPDRDTKCKIAGLLGMSVDELFKDKK